MTILSQTTPAQKLEFQTAIERTTAMKLRRAAASARYPDQAALSAATVATVGSLTFDAALTKIYSNAAMLNSVKVTGGCATVFGGSYRFPVAYSGSFAGNIGNNLNAWQSEIEFLTDAPKLQIVVQGASATYYYRVLVDNQYVNATPQAYAAADNTITIDLSALPAGTHTVRLETTNSTLLTSVRCAPIYTIRKPSVRDGVIALMTGDSYTEGQGSEYRQMGSWGKDLGKRLGWTDVRQVAIGGTGYLTLGTAAQLAVPDQVEKWFTVNPDLDPAKVDVVCIASGFNDADPGTDPNAAIYTNLYNAVMLTFARARAACPNAMMIVFGPWNGRRGDRATQSMNVEAVVLAAFSAWIDTNKLFVPVTNAPGSSWFTGTGYSGATNSSGNTDNYIAADFTHPLLTGHRYLGACAEAGIRNALA